MALLNDELDQSGLSIPETCVIDKHDLPSFTYSHLSKHICALVIIWVYSCGVIKCFYGRGVSSTAPHDQVKFNSFI